MDNSDRESATHYPPPIPQDELDRGRILFKDGTSALLRPAEDEDLPLIQELLESISDRSRYLRFFSGREPSPEMARHLLETGDPEERFTLLVLHGDKRDRKVIGVGNYVREETEDAAETAFLVHDDFQGRGIGTLLLERLALIAVRNGITRFKAYTLPENEEMLDVFRSSGFPVDESFEDSTVEVSFSVRPSKEMVDRAETRDRIATVASLQPFFHPRGVAVVGASRDPSSIGYRVLESLVMNRFQGPVYPVNPAAEVVGSISAYDSVNNVPGPVDLAVLAVPPSVVPDVVDECAEKGVSALVVLTAGYSETGSEGQHRQQTLRDQVLGHGMRMVGPNCLGLINTDPEVRLNASFSPLFPSEGTIAMASQSGALGLAILNYAKSHDIGFSSFVSVGNKADVSGNDLIQYWEDDERTDVILLYLESFGNPRRFARLTQRVGLKKPILVVKGGRSEAGRRAASSHTAALTGSEVAVDALFKQAGIIRAETLEEMFDLAAFLTTQPLPRGPRVAVVTNAGGPAILCADACENGGLTLAELSDDTRERLASFLPETASLTNPVDMIASADEDEYRRTVKTVLEDSNVDAVIVIYIPLELSVPDRIPRAIEDGIREAENGEVDEKPLAGVFLESGEQRVRMSLETERFPAYRFPESAAVALAKSYEYVQWRQKYESHPREIRQLPGTNTQRARELCERIAEQDPGWLGALQTRDLLEAVSIPVAELDLARNPEEAVEIAHRIGYPVVVKMASRTLIHKTEWDGIRLDVQGDLELREAYREIEDRLEEAGKLDQLDGMVVQRHVEGGTELLVGMNEDPLFGPLVTFGLGGIHVEVLRDVSVRITPLTEVDAREMIDDLRGRQLLDGYRGHPPADKDALQELLLRLSRLVEAVPEIKELEINPLVAFPPGEGYLALDARARVESSVRSSREPSASSA